MGFHCACLAESRQCRTVSLGVAVASVNEDGYVHFQPVTVSPSSGFRLNKKEQLDVAICNLGDSISDACWNKLSDKLRHTFASYCCSANHLSDYRDNRTGRACGCAQSYWTTTMGNCRDCCTKAGIGPDTHDVT